MYTDPEKELMTAWRQVKRYVDMTTRELPAPSYGRLLKSLELLAEVDGKLPLILDSSERFQHRLFVRQLTAVRDGSASPSSVAQTDVHLPAIFDLVRELHGRLGESLTASG